MTDYVDIVFHPESEQFVEVETADGRSISFARWVKRDDGYLALRIIPHADDLPHMHVAGTTVGKDIDECARCGQDIRCSIHRTTEHKP